jgi:two-component system sensor histidine kinase CpxA
LQLAVALAEKNIWKNEEQKKHLARCELETERLDEMIADVLTLSRLEHSYNTFTAEDSIEISTLVKEIVNDCQYYANSKSVTINLETKVTCILQADVKLLTSAINNILNNAVKYSPNGLTVNVALTRQADKIILNVSDQGTGVPSDMITKLFTPFFRVAESRDRRSGGTGLGLAIAQQAIHLHGGEISAQNIEPRGLSLIITLPADA